MRTRHMTLALMLVLVIGACCQNLMDYQTSENRRVTKSNKICEETCGTADGVECDDTKDPVACGCVDDRIFDASTKHCKKKCSVVNKCKYGEKCEGNLCKCPYGNSGVVCENAVDREDCLKAFPECLSSGGTCSYSKAGMYCYCGGAKYFHPDTKRCTDVCKPNPCLNGGTCDVTTGVAKCICAEGFSGITCEKYVCEPNPCLNGGTCKILRGQATCTCAEGFSGTVCEKHVCKPNPCLNGGICKVINGMANCICAEGYSGETCEKSCDCGENAVSCSFDNGQKVCECKEAFSTNGRYCEACDCRENAVSCSFENGQKVCNCEEGFTTNGGYCEECFCGENTKQCRFVKEKKICECDEGYASMDGICTECFCGENTKQCRFVKEKKICECEEGYASMDGICTECFCGSNTKQCRFNKEEKICECDEGYALKDGICTDVSMCEDGDCMNGGICKAHDNGRKFCECKQGSTGDYCEYVPACDHPKFKYCKGDNGTCVLSDIPNIAKCECTSAKKFDNSRHMCRDICEGEGCKNGGICKAHGNGDRFCECQQGSTGDYCEYVPACEHPKFIYCKGENGTCVLSDKSKTPECLCEYEKKFDNNLHMCRGTCQNEDCMNGGICKTHGNGDKFCECREGSAGDYCEYVSACEHSKFIYCKGENGTCVLSDKSTEAKCECSDGKRFDNILHICVEKCSIVNKCKYGEKCQDGLCKCPYATSGDVCDKVKREDCWHMFEKCLSSGGICKYSKNGSMHCDCGEKYFHPATKQCTDNCKEDIMCEYGEKCIDGVCRCTYNNAGMICDAVETGDCLKRFPKCMSSGGICKYIRNQTVTCDCGLKHFHAQKQECAEKCKEDGVCEYGEKCIYGVCRCPYFNAGMPCDAVEQEDCLESFPKCMSSGGICKYSRSRMVRCDCGLKYFHAQNQECADLCYPNPCNEGTCNVLHGKVNCTCPAWLTGEFCETDMCSSNPCNGGSCNIVHGKVKCNCPDWLTGEFCETEHPCAKHSCYNEGICKIDDTGKPQCFCKEPFSGELCEKDLCSEHPCQNGGTCQILHGTYNCICSEPYFGNKCEKDNRYMWMSFIVVALIVLVFAFLLCGSCMWQRNQKLKVMLLESQANKSPTKMP